MEDGSKVLLGKLGVPEAQHLKNSLAKHGFEIAVIHNHASCNKGCSPQVEVWANSEDVTDILQTVSAAQRAEWAGNGYDAELANQVFDPDASEATCPACGTKFSPTQASCPDCGLCFGIDG